MIFGRGERIRTSGLYVPNVALYQAKLHPEAEREIVAKLKTWPSHRTGGASCQPILDTRLGSPWVGMAER